MEKKRESGLGYKIREIGKRDSRENALKSIPLVWRDLTGLEGVPSSHGHRAEEEDGRVLDLDESTEDGSLVGVGGCVDVKEAVRESEGGRPVPVRGDERELDGLVLLGDVGVAVEQVESEDDGRNLVSCCWRSPAPDHCPLQNQSQQGQMKTGDMPREGAGLTLTPISVSTSLTRDAFLC